MGMGDRDRGGCVCVRGTVGPRPAIGLAAKGVIGSMVCYQRR